MRVGVGADEGGRGVAWKKPQRGEVSCQRRDVGKKLFLADP